MTCRSASVSFFSGTATRTMSAPAAASLLISRTHESMSYVYPEVIVCTDTGACQPLLTKPTRASQTGVVRVWGSGVIRLNRGEAGPERVGERRPGYDIAKPS